MSHCPRARSPSCSPISRVRRGSSASSMSATRCCLRSIGGCCAPRSNIAEAPRSAPRDSFFVAFGSASDAVEAAREGQAALGDGPVRVRMGLHSGEATEIEEGYAGMNVHRAARICSAAHGGQVVLSEQTLALAEVDGPVRDLGHHDSRTWLSRSASTSWEKATSRRFRSLNATNLPAQPTPLIGRSGEVARVIERLRSEDVRLLTLTGAGGSGKTRLALQVAAELVDDFADGVFWVPLSTVGEPAFVLPTIGRTLGATNGVAKHVDEKRMLLLLDNLEHVLAVAPDLSNSSPGVRTCICSLRVVPCCGSPPSASSRYRRCPSVMPSPCSWIVLERFGRTCAR